MYPNAQMNNVNYFQVGSGMWFSKAIKNYREVNEITQVQMKELIRRMDGVFLRLNKAAYYRWEQGRTRPSVYKRCQILSGLGLDKCVARLANENSDKFEMLKLYMNQRFATPLSSDVLYVTSMEKVEYTFDASEKANASLLQFYGSIQKKIFKIKHPFDFLNDILDKSDCSCFNLYRSKRTNNVISHSLNTVIDFDSLNTAICKHHEGLNPSLNTMKMYGFESNEKVLFMMCGFSCTENIFKHQLSIINSLLFKNRDIKKVYVRSYDKELTHLICKLYDGIVIHKPRNVSSEEQNWTGLVFDPVLFELSQSHFLESNESCPYLGSQQCQQEGCDYA